MSAHNADDRAPLPPELLAAYADGELSPAECQRVEAWLADHPEARADVEAQRRLARLFDEAVPPAPADDQWADALARVEQRLAAPPVGRPAWRRRAAIALAAAAAVAALVLLALALKGPPSPAPEAQPEPLADEAWPVVSADDVEILSMDDRDRGAIVVGEPPVSEPLEMLTEDEVKVNKWPDGPGRVGRLRVSPGPGAPYVQMSVEQEPDEDP
jgi:anti-sigma factor RsiW